MLPIPAVDAFHIAQGAHVGIVKPEDGFLSRVPVTWPDFVKMMTTFTISESKTGTYVCRPMGGDGARSDANAEAWPLVPLDIDQMLPTELPVLAKWCEDQGLDVIMATTYSHTLEAPRARLWVRCSRPVTANEHLFLFKAFNQVAVLPFPLDAATAKPSQPIYLPRCPPERSALATARYYPGKQLDVDGMLREFQREMNELKQRDEAERFVGKGVRAPGGLIECFNKHFNVPELLEAHGYKRRSRNRFLAPNSQSGRPAIAIHDHGLISFHEPSHDPLSKRDSLNRPRVLDPFACFAILEHSDEFIPAWKEAERISRAKGWLIEEKRAASAPSVPTKYDMRGGPQRLREKKPLEFIVEGLLPQRSIVLVTGDSNSGKTMLMQYLAACVVLGQPFANHETAKGFVVWVAGEDVDNAENRFPALADEMNSDFDRDFDESRMRIVTPAVKVLQKDPMDAFHETVAEIMGAAVHISLLILDSKSFCWGGEDENSNDENSRFLEEVANHFVNRYGCAVLILHHLTKAKDEQEQTARGAGALINNCDSEWRCQQKQGTVVLSPGAKLRVPPWDPMRFAVKVVELDRVKYAHLVNSKGNMPKTSVPQLTNRFGVGARQAQEDQEYAAIISALTTLPVAKRERSAASVAEKMGKIVAGSSPADIERERSWVRSRMRKMQEQKLLDRDYGVLKAGEDLLNQVMMLCEPSVSKEEATGTQDREPGSDDE